MLVKVSRVHLCSPRDDNGPYTGVEVTQPNEFAFEDLLLAYTDSHTPPMICGYVPTRYVNVPTQVIQTVIHQKHAEMTYDSGKLPPMTEAEVDEDGC